MGTVANVMIGAPTSISVKNPYSAAEWAVCGYTDGGAVVTYEPAVTDVPVDQETVPIDAVLTGENIRIQVNLAEATLANLTAAMAGASLSSKTITLGVSGGSVLQFIGVKLVGKAPAGETRTVTITKGYAVASVSLPFKKDGAQIVPLEVKAIKPASGGACTIVDAA